ncbi:MAG: hypothetical protein ACJASQ_000432 [Crocinitomicaceae bacterium]|jgi:hypothetical protein
MGKLDNSDFKVNLNIRKDSLNNREKIDSDKSYWITNPYYYWGQEFTTENENLFVEFTKEGTTRTEGSIKVDNNFTSNRVTSKSLLALGNVQLTSQAYLKIKNLYLIPGFGRPEIFKFKNLESLTIQSPYNCFIPLQFYSSDTKHSYSSLIQFAGDVNFMNEVSRLYKLKNLRIEIGQNKLFYSTPINLLLLEGLDENIFSSPELESVYLTGVSFLPIDYQGVKQLKYLEVQGIKFPELLNIALAFETDKKDTNEGDWFFWLNNLVDIENSNIDVSNGLVQSYYKNGELLSQGGMVNNEPDGTWKFWYPDGKLCEERHYKIGTRTGTWVFRNPSDNWRIDTTLILKYDDDKLISRKEFSYDYTSPCFQAEPSYEITVVTEYQIEWLPESEVKISKRTQFEGIRGSVENWFFDKTNWNYSKTTFCDGDTILREQFAGYDGQIPYEIKKVGNCNSLTNGRGCQNYWSLNLRNCSFEQYKYYIDDEHGKKIIGDRIKSVIQSEDWNCH